MSTTFRPYAPDQMLLLPADLRAWLPEGHVAHHVSDLVDGVDLTAFYAPYAGDGRRNAPDAPRMMVKVLLYAYATGVFSSRGIARKLEEDVAFRVLGAGNFPQHRTLCEFRRRHVSDCKELFVAVVRLARELGLARFGKLSIDGTKVRANASKRKAMSYGRIAKEERRLRGEIEALLAAAGAADAAEDARLGADVRGDELPAEWRRREDRLAAIRAAKSRLEAQQRAADDARGRQPDQDRNPKGGPPYTRSYGEPDAKAQSNFTDPEKYPATSRMAEKLSRPAGRAAYAERTWLSEAPNGWIKHVLGFRRFSRRGLAKVQGEWDLVCLALNTKRLHALMAA